MKMEDHHPKQQNDENDADDVISVASALAVDILFFFYHGNCFSMQLISNTRT